MSTPSTRQTQPPSPLAQAQALLAEATRVVFFTGAGMSAESGLETYRDSETGLWENVDPLAMASIDAWEADPEPMWAWYLWRTHNSQVAQPNAGHAAINKYAASSPHRTVTVVTQNIDDLHDRGADPSLRVLHLHGSLFKFRCESCGAPHALPTIPADAAPRRTPPRCHQCTGQIRPDIVWFGEGLPHNVWADAEKAMLTADVVVIVGTSGVVYPAAGLPRLAAQAGATVVEISPSPSELTPLAHYALRGTAATTLPHILGVA